MAADLPGTFALFRSSEHAHITKNNGFTLVSLLPPSTPPKSPILLIKILWREQMLPPPSILPCHEHLFPMIIVCKQSWHYILLVINLKNGKNLENKNSDLQKEMYASSYCCISTRTYFKRDTTVSNSCIKPGSYFLRYEFWCHKFAMNNSHQLTCPKLLRNIRCENRQVTSKVASHSQKVWTGINLSAVLGDTTLLHWHNN